ncbi:MAG: hypothetical protein KAG18_00115 [Sinobacterium sp.]|nr:hypothetical protein [Sinobacterium sp.]
MIRVFLLLLSTIAGFWYVAYTLETKGPGYVWVSYNNYSIETTFWVFTGLLVGFIAFIYLALFLIRLAIRSLKQLGFLSKNWGVSKSEQSMTVFRLAYADAHWEKASDAFKKGAKKSSVMPSDYIMAIRSALHLGDVSEAKTQLANVKTLSGIDELSLRLLELDIAMSESNSGLALTLYSRLLKDYPKESNLKAKAFDYFLTQKSYEKATATFNSMSRKQQKQFKQNFAMVEQANIQQTSHIDALKPVLKAIHKQPASLQIAVLEKAQELDVKLAIKYLLQALKHHNLDGLAALQSFTLNEDDALELIKHIDSQLSKENSQALNASMLAGLAQLNSCAKLTNKALDLFQQSLSLEHNRAVFSRYIQLLKLHKTANEMNAAIVQLSENK